MSGRAGGCAEAARLRVRGGRGAGRASPRGARAGGGLAAQAGEPAGARLQARHRPPAQLTC